MAVELRQTIEQAYRADEAACITDLLAGLPPDAYDQETAQANARWLIDQVRRQHSGGNVLARLMHEFSLSSREGVALMCLAEALLRIPDEATASRLIRDKIGHGDWRSHLGNPSLFVNAAAWTLMLTGKTVAPGGDDALPQALAGILQRAGEPLIRRGIDFAMRLLGRQFIMGTTIGDALARSRHAAKRGYTHSFDMLGEAALTNADAERYFASYCAAIHAIGAASHGLGVQRGPGVSVKLSALHPRYETRQRERAMHELLPRLTELMRLAAHYDIGLAVDAEETDRLDLSLDLFEAALEKLATPEWAGAGFVVQSYQKRCIAVIDWLIDLARRRNQKLMVRLVKGAYWDGEIKRAQVDGLNDYPVFTRKAHSDLAYLACAARLLASQDNIYPQFATHNALTLTTVFAMAQRAGATAYEFQCLHGMGEPLYDHVVSPERFGLPCRIYAPVGSHETLLPYLVRRLLENGANTSFVNLIVDERATLDAVLADPRDTVRHEGSARHPAIPLPRDLLQPERINSFGADLADPCVLAAMEVEMAALSTRNWLARPLLADGTVIATPPRPVRNPARRDGSPGSVIEANVEHSERALTLAADFVPTWFATPPAERAAALERAADLMEQRRAELVSLCVREGGKTWPNAIGEIREAVDFCRYYAAQLRYPGRVEATAPPGPAVCISPWNFPLAIFVGEVSAALAAGSPVIAKPARQTPLIAHRAVELFHEAGIPRAALQFLPGSGSTLGSALTGDPRVRSVVFTGSTEVARQIQHSLAAPEATRLIAETGGQNAMIVDSSALPEQVVRDVLISGFDSAGQRCSALRVLCLQRDIADTMESLLQAAMRELAIGDPAQYTTDIGPVIDEAAQEALLAHIEGMRRRGRPVFQAPLPPACAQGCFVPPTLIGIDALDELDREVFGPIVHVLRFDGEHLDELIDAINRTGYGLTMGLHSRLDETIRRVTSRARVGNLYVNRSMIGAVVGVQPFGGEGLSGTGPKAGGPLYLPRLAGCANVPPAALGLPTRMPSDDSPLAALRCWAEDSDHKTLARYCAACAALTLNGQRIDLPGPTGEQNTLSFAPRGALFCLAPNIEQRLNQFAAVLATGNRARFIDDAVTRDLSALLPATLAGQIDIADRFAPEDCQGILFSGGTADVRRLYADLHRGSGPLIPVFLPALEDGLYPLYRMQLERVVSINTTASGGNTALMTLSA